MNQTINLNWHKIVEKLDYAFQPIINIHSGKTYGVEALLRNTEKLNNPKIQTISSLFNVANDYKVLYELDLMLRDIAFKKFSQIDIENLQLFYNLDNRIIYNKSYSKGNTKKLLKKYNLSKNSICYEVSEKGSLEEQNAVIDVIRNYKKRDYSIAIDDFGVGVSGLKLLYHAQTNLIKLDRFFISNIEEDPKKRLFCSSIIDMAHSMGIKVVAEGIETKKEYYVCKEIGADYAQGFFIQKPTTNLSEIKTTYPKIKELIDASNRINKVQRIDEKYLDYIEPLNIKSSLHTLFLYFKQYSKNYFVPIVDDFNNLMGVIYEVDIKKISYSRYGLALAQNESYSSNLKKYIKQSSQIDVTWGIDKTLEIFNTDPNSSGVFVTQDEKYKGFIDLRSLLKLSYNRNLEIASNQNPLTKLPGNKQIEQFISKAIKNKNENITHILYFDFNNFKPFNDYYGFRLGDRAILIFSELLQKYYIKDSFVAHIGGDDFFVGLTNENIEEIYFITCGFLDNFKRDVSNLYSKKDRENGYILAKNRDGEKTKFKLLECACAIIEISKYSNMNNFDQTISVLKKESKSSKRPILSSF